MGGAGERDIAAERDLRAGERDIAHAVQRQIAPDLGLPAVGVLGFALVARQLPAGFAGHGRGAEGEGLHAVDERADLDLACGQQQEIAPGAQAAALDAQRAMRGHVDFGRLRRVPLVPRRGRREQLPEQPQMALGKAPVGQPFPDRLLSGPGLGTEEGGEQRRLPGPQHDAALRRERRAGVSGLRHLAEEDQRVLRLFRRQGRQARVAAQAAGAAQGGG